MNQAVPKVFFILYPIQGCHFQFLENDIPIPIDIVDSSVKIIPIQQRRKSAALLSLEEMNDLEERFDKWMNNRSKKIIDDLFDGLKVCSLNER